MPTVAEVARIWNSAGVSTIPVLNDGTKRPAIRWGQYQVELPLSGQLDEWWGNGHAQLGLALICGEVSGNMEMTELEADAAEGSLLIDIQNELDQIGYGYVWDKLNGPHGYMEWTPSGGIHWMYRIADNPVPGNSKIAVSETGKVLSETRGEGGYVIVAPTSGLVHPTGESWSLAVGEYGQLLELSWRERCAFHKALATVLDRREQPPAPAPLPVLASPSPVSGGAGSRPGDLWAQQTSWRDLLEADGFQFSHATGEEEYYARPGKDPRLGHSVTVNYRGSDLLKVFSSNIPELAPDLTYSKFGYLASYRFNGSFYAATQSLVSQGFSGPSNPVQVLDEFIPTPARTRPRMIRDDDGLAKDFVYWHFDKFGYSPIFNFHMNMFMAWDGRKWAPDHKGVTVDRYFDFTEERLMAAETANNETETKYWRRTRFMARCDAVMRRLKSLKDVSVGGDEMDTERHLLNLGNGTFNLRTRELQPHNPDEKITRVMAGAYDLKATAPRFRQFMEEVLPDPETRRYVQRAMGYTLFGDSDQRAMFLIYGPSGTGKSQFIECMRMIFGDYAVTAPPGTFKASRDKGPTHDLHQLRGRRFVSSSETAESTAFDEDMLKRLTGRDELTSRDLYEKHQSWVPQCSIWIATNHPPRFNSDDNAIWKRAKLIPFLTEFTRDGQFKEEPDLARKVLIKEADGILNWLLEGLYDFLEHGLGEPAQILEAVAEHRSQSDQVMRFIEENVDDGVLELEHEAKIKGKELYRIYLEWLKETGERALGQRRFVHRLESGRLALRYVRESTGRAWRGIGRRAGVSVLGTMVPGFA